MRRLEEAEEGDEFLSAVTARGEVVVEGHSVGHVAGFIFLPDPVAEGAEKRLVQRAARRALREEMPRRVGLLEQAPDSAFTLAGEHGVAWEGAPVARLRAGPALTRPQIEVLDSEFLDGPQRERVRSRLQGWIDRALARDLAPLFAAVERARRDPALRGPVHRLLEHGGVVPGATEAEIPAELRGRLRAIGVRAGRYALFLPDCLRARAAARRAQLWAIERRVPTPELPNPSLVSVAASPGPALECLRAMGWVEAGPVMIRLDMAERIAAELAYATRARAAPLPPDLASRLGLKADMLPAVLRALGLRLLPAPALAAGEYGPPTPPMIAGPRRKPVPAVAPRLAARPDHPFAALAAWPR
jgi:ATP-dependent RNA helicase SUPV3L1/SUV3